MALNDSLAVLVGAGPGLGLSIARRFAGEGFEIALVGRDAHSLESLDTSGMRTGLYAADAGDIASLTACLAQIRDERGDAAVLLFNPSYSYDATPTELPPEEAVRGLGLGVVSAVVATQAVHPAMAEAGRGTMLFTGSAAGLKPWVGGAVVGMQKAALRNYVLALSEEVAPQGIHAATVTIHGVLKSGSFFDPELIARAYWDVHTQPRDEWQAEFAYRDS